MLLSKAAMRTALQALAPGMYAEGKSYNEILRTARKIFGTGYGRSEMLNDVRTALDLRKYEGFISRLKPGQAIPRIMIPERNLRSTAKYLIRGEASYRDSATGKVTKELQSFYSDELKTPQELIDEANSALGNKYQQMKGGMTSFELKGIVHNQAQEW